MFQTPCATTRETAHHNKDPNSQIKKIKICAKRTTDLGMKKASQPGGPKLCFLVIGTKWRKTQRFIERIYLTPDASIIQVINPKGNQS